MSINAKEAARNQKRQQCPTAAPPISKNAKKHQTAPSASKDRSRGRRSSILRVFLVIWILLAFVRLISLHSQMMSASSYMVSLYYADADGPAASSTDENRYSRRHHAIVIPFRNRTAHLERFIEYMGPYLTRNFPRDDFSLYVIDQADDDHFNRGFLFNAGLTLVREHLPGTHCVILHDVDLVPRDDGVPYTDCLKPIQLGSELEHYNWSYPYPKNCGGVISMHMVDWQTINGLSNDYEGWGGEDDDLYYRLLRNNLLRGEEDNIIRRPPRGKGAFVNLEVYAKETVTVTVTDENNVQQNKTEEKQIWKGNRNPHYKQNFAMLRLMEKNKRRWQDDGLSDLDYTIIQEETRRSFGFFEIHHVKVLGQVGWEPPPFTLPSQQYGSQQSRSDDKKHHKKQERKGTTMARSQPLEFIHIMHTGGDILERAAAKAGIAWGACHYNHALFKEMQCPSPPDLQDKVRLQYYTQSVPWHVPLTAFAIRPFANAVPKFTIVRNPYDRAVAMYFNEWTGYKGDNPQDPSNLNEFIQSVIRRQQDEEETDKEETSIFLPQYRYVLQGRRKIVPNLLHYESLHKEFPLLMRAYKLNITLPSQLSYGNTRATSFGLGVDDFTNETVRLINRYAKIDFALFDYEMKQVPDERRRDGSNPIHRPSSVGTTNSAYG